MSRLFCWAAGIICCLVSLLTPSGDLRMSLLGLTLVVLSLALPRETGQ